MRRQATVAGGGNEVMRFGKNYLQSAATEVVLLKKLGEKEVQSHRRASAATG
jgi:hypothetical protein